MKLKGGGFAAVLVAIAIFIGYNMVNPGANPSRIKKDLTILHDEDEEIETSNSQKRERHEWLLLRDPKTGKIPDGIRTKELTWVRTMPIRKNGLFNKSDIQSSANTGSLPLFSETNNYTNSVIGNSYQAVGGTAFSI